MKLSPEVLEILAEYDALDGDHAAVVAMKEEAENGGSYDRADEAEADLNESYAELLARLVAHLRA